MRIDSCAASGLVVVAVIAIGGCTTGGSARDHQARAPQACEDLTMQIYFETNSAQVTPEAARVLKAASSRARRCTVTGVEAFGLADATGDPQANLELSQRRAEAVTAALQATGLSGVEVRQGAAGEAGAVTQKGASQPLRRRVDLIIHRTSAK